MICSRCNCNIPDGFRFCPKCGRSVYFQRFEILYSDWVKRFKGKFIFWFRNPKIFIATILLIFIATCFAGNYLYQKSEFSPAGKIAKIQRQQEAFMVWRSKLSVELKEHEEKWEARGKFLDDLDKAKLNVAEAVISLDTLSDILYLESKSVNRLKAPEELSKEHRRILNDAIDDIYYAILSRREACEIMKNACNYGDPYSYKTLSGVYTELEYYSSHLAKATLAISSVQLELEDLKNKINTGEK